MSFRLPATPRFRPQGHLLRTTALVSLLSTLASLQPAQAQLVLDNADPGSQPLRSVTGTWAASSLIWYNPNSLQWEALSNGGIAVLDARQNNDDVTLTVETVDPNTGTPAPIRIDGIQVNENGYTLTGGTLNGTGMGVRFLTDDPADAVSIDVDSALDATVIVEEGVTLNYGGVTTSSPGARVEAGATLTTSSAAITRGALTVIGTAVVDGSHVGSVTNDGTITLNGILNADTAADRVTNNADFTMAGGQLNVAVDNSFDGDFVLSDGTVTADVSNAGEFDQSGGTVVGTVTNAENYLMFGGRITGDVTNTGTFSQQTDAVIDGNVTSMAGGAEGYRLRGGEVTGDVTNSGLMTAYGRIGGTLTNNTGGALSIDDGRQLTVAGTIINHSQLTLEDYSVVSGDIDSRVNSTTTIDAARVVGSLTSDGDVYILNGDNEVTGDLGIGADGQLQLVASTDAGVTVGGRLTSAGSINTDDSGDLTITADEILLLNASGVEADGSVRLVGTEVVQGSKIFSANEGLADGLIDGGILNEATGTVLLRPGVEVNGDGYAITNFGRTELEGPGASLFNLGSFENTGVDARLIIATGSEVYSDLMTNTGRITNGGTLSVTTGARLLENQLDGKLTNTGWIVANVDNVAGATLISSNRIDGDVANDGIAYLSGTITGELDNSSADVTLQDLLAVGSLRNTGSQAYIRVNRNQTLTSAGLVENSGTLAVAGDLVGSVTNSGILTVDGGLDGNVGNTGSLTSTGTITGDVTNDGSALLAGTIDGDLTNHTADLDVTGNLRVGRLRNSGSAAEMTIAAGQTLTSDSTAINSGTLNIAGALSGNVTNSGTLNSTGTITGNVSNSQNLNSSGTITGDLDNDGTAVLAGTITGQLDNSSSLTLSDDLTVGSLNNSASTAAITVGANQTLTSNGAVANDGTLNVELDGTLAATGNITNRNVMDVAGTASTDGNLRNRGTLDVSGELTAAGDLDSSGTMTVTGAATIGGDVDNTGTLNVNGTLTADGAVENNRLMNVNGDLTAAGGITNEETLNIAGSVTGAVVNNNEMI